MFIPDPDFYPSWIQDPGSRIPDPKTEGLKKLVVIAFCVAINFTKLYLMLFLKTEDKIFGKFSKNSRTFYPKKCHSSSQKYGFGIQDPGSIKNLFRIPNPGSRGQKGTGSWIRIRNTGYWYGQCCGSGIRGLVPF